MYIGFPAFFGGGGGETRLSRRGGEGEGVPLSVSIPAVSKWAGENAGCFWNLHFFRSMHFPLLRYSIIATSLAAQ